MFVPFKFEKFEPGMKLHIRMTDDDPKQQPDATLPVQHVVKIAPIPGDTEPLMLVFFEGGDYVVIRQSDATAPDQGSVYLMEIPDRFSVVFLEAVADSVWIFRPPGEYSTLLTFKSEDEARDYADGVVQARSEISDRPLTYVIANLSNLYQE